MKLGNSNGARALRGKQTGNREAVAAIRLNAQEHAVNLRSIVEHILAHGTTSVRKIVTRVGAKARGVFLDWPKRARTPTRPCAARDRGDTATRRHVATPNRPSFERTRDHRAPRRAVVREVGEQRARACVAAPIGLSRTWGRHPPRLVH